MVGQNIANHSIFEKNDLNVFFEKSNNTASKAVSQRKKASCL